MYGMEMQSAYYKTFMENMEKYGIAPPAYEQAAGAIQGVEEMMFGFAMYILM